MSTLPLNAKHEKAVSLGPAGPMLSLQGPALQGVEQILASFASHTYFAATIFDCSLLYPSKSYLVLG